MATVKAFTDIPQSKKLAEFLPLETADMIIVSIGDREGVKTTTMPKETFNILRTPFTDIRNTIPCWSLAALLKQLKSEIILENKQILFLHLNKYDNNSYEVRCTNSWTGEVLIAEAYHLVDACVTMIEKLQELNLL